VRARVGTRVCARGPAIGQPSTAATPTSSSWRWPISTQGRCFLAPPSWPLCGCVQAVRLLPPPPFIPLPCAHVGVRACVRACVCTRTSLLGVLRAGLAGPPEVATACQARLVLLEGERFKFASSLAAEVLPLLAQFDGLDGWTQTGNSSGIKAYYKKDPEGAMHAFRVEGEVQAPIFNVISILYELDLSTCAPVGVRSSLLTLCGYGVLLGSAELS
jgi:hypothetical protein